MKNSNYKTQALLILFLLFNTKGFSQTFTKITSTLNPIVTDTARSGGGSWIDIDNDNDLDLFVSNGNLTTENNSLYINNGGGNFTKITTGSIVTDGGSSIGSTWGDYNNDGNLDCFVTNRNNFGNFLYEGNGTSNPVKQTGISLVTDIANSNSSSWIDIDNDGDLDLYTVNFMGNDFLYLNNGSFSNNQNNPIQSDGSNFSIPGLWADYNNDLKPDLFVGNAGNQNDKLYTNNGGLNFTALTFTDGTPTLGGSWGDYDNDGDLDLFVANYLAQTNILYNNSGAPNYILTLAPTSPVMVVGNNVGSAWGDIDNDGDQDLFVCDDGGNNHLFINSGFPAYTFNNVTTGQIVNDGGNSFGCVLADYDYDGQLDAFVANQLNQQNFLYHNDGNSNNWITIKCVGVLSNKTAIGAKVFVKANIAGNDIWQMQEVLAQTGYNSQNLWLHFGFGLTSIIDTLIVKYPSGNVDTCVNISTNAFYNPTEGACLTSVGIKNIESQNKDFFRVSIYPNPADNILSFNYTVLLPSQIKVSIINPEGKSILTKQVKSKMGNNLESLDIKYLASGAYTLILSDEEKTSSATFIKQ
ncbi:MAG: FG-GAP-like repeat-containing protein [Bacteroidia bacterium]